ncbi:MAG: GDP-mannose pyrophosphatase NudK [bacterium]|nr:GDP-mannose pyrophosphatase NudK [bacterium]
MQEPRVKNLEKTLLSDNWYRLDKVTYDIQTKDGNWETHTREAYDRGNGATILLYNRKNGTIILTRQFRLPTYINGNENGLMIEACAGLLDKDDPETCIRKEAEEETGYKIKSIEKVFEAYMSPGSVTEILYFFIAEYDEEMKISEGGGLAHEQENIEVLEIPFGEAMQMIKSGEIKDGKTIMLLQHLQIEGVF